MHFSDEDTGVRLISTYSRTVGAIQLFYASFFAWVAFPRLRWSFDPVPPSPSRLWVESRR
jgi:hypothetical protein